MMLPSIQKNFDMASTRTDSMLGEEARFSMPIFSLMFFIAGPELSLGRGFVAIVTSALMSLYAKSVARRFINHWDPSQTSTNYAAGKSVEELYGNFRRTTLPHYYGVQMLAGGVMLGTLPIKLPLLRFFYCDNS